MSLQDITREAVRAAMAECDSLGRDEFLAKYGFRRALRYVIRENGREYDSKAIAGAARGFQFPEQGPLRSVDFTGGEQSTVRKLRSLGFEVIDLSAEPSEGSHEPVLFILTAANPHARAHLQRSLRDGVELELLEPLSEITDDLLQHAQDGRVFAWGARPGSSSEKRWNRLGPGDIGLVYSEGRFVLSCRVYAKAKSEDVARSIWGEAENGETWACMSFFDPVEEVDISLDQVRSALGYQDNYVPQGFEIPGEDAQLRVVEEFGSAETAIAELSKAASEQPKVWWVNQGQSYARSHDGGYLWAPKVDRAGRGRGDWDSLTLVRKGDRVLNYANGRIRALSSVLDGAFDAPRPSAEDEESWTNDGRRLNVEYRDLDPTIQLGEIPPEWRVEEDGPFDQGGSVKQGYFFPLSLDFVAKLATKFPHLGLSGVPRQRQPLTVEAVKEQATGDPYRLRLPDEIYATVVAALESGKHVILTGPPGTAKTTLAEAIADTAGRLGQCDGYVVTTATADWTTYETIGGLQPTADGGLEFRYGHFLEAISNRRWLVIDELNRSQFDRAFGQLFTVLSGQAVTLPYARPGAESRLTLCPADRALESAGDVLQIPASWRVVATMNVFDKSLLFEMSYALMRRFAFVEVPSPADDVFEELIDGWSEGSPPAAELAKSLTTVRAVKDIGPAVYRDIARFGKHRFEDEAADPDEVRFQAFYSYLLPQFEGISDEQGERLFSRLTTAIGSSAAWRDRIQSTLDEVLGLELGQGAVSDGDEPESPERADATDPTSDAGAA